MSCNVLGLMAETRLHNGGLGIVPTQAGAHLNSDVSYAASESAA